jgi:hypothetical protein
MQLVIPKERFSKKRLRTCDRAESNAKQRKTLMPGEAGAHWNNRREYPE